MKLFKVGEKSKAICESCKVIRPTTFQLRDVPFSSGSGVAKNILVATCDHCDEVVSIPQQSVPRIKEALKPVRHPLEARIPRQLFDALIVACNELNSGEDAKNVLFRYYLSKLSKRKSIKKHMHELLKLDDAKGKRDERFSIKLNEDMNSIFKKMVIDTKLTPADVVNSIFLEIKTELLDSKNKSIDFWVSTVSATKAFNPC
jgi:hypothetical protein